MRRRRNRATWFPILGFDSQGTGTAGGLQTPDVRDIAVRQDASPNIAIVPIIPDIDVPPEQGQTAGGIVQTTLRDFVEGQTCVIDRIVGTIVAAHEQFDPTGDEQEVITQSIVGAGIAVVPTEDDGTGNPAVSATNLDPLRADNSQNPWMWRRVWVLANQNENAQPQSASALHFPKCNTEYGDIRSGPHIDTKGVKRAIRREERIFLIFSVLPVIPANSISTLDAVVRLVTDIRVLGHMNRAKNRSNFK